MKRKAKKPEGNQDYVVKVGKAADKRLGILNNIFRSSTALFLTQLGLKKGMSVLEVGCGTGHVTIDLANIVGEGGHVHAVDISKEQITVTNENVEKEKLKNVSTEVLDVVDLKADNQYDFVVSRFILMHIKSPEAALLAMYACVKPGGILACEEPEMSKCYSSIPSDDFSTAMKWHIAYSQKMKLDFDIGSKLKTTFETLNFTNVEERHAQPIVKDDEPEKEIYVLLTEECRDKYKTQELATDEEITQVVTGLKALTENKSSFFGCAFLHQVSAQKKQSAEPKSNSLAMVEFK